jgi:hypothetical protein
MKNHPHMDSPAMHVDMPTRNRPTSQKGLPETMEPPAWGPTLQGPFESGNPQQSQPNPVPGNEFMQAHAEARHGSFNEYGSYTGPTMPGILGHSPMDSTDCDQQCYVPGAPTMVTHVMDGDRAYDWPDAPGGQLGHVSDDYKS